MKRVVIAAIAMAALAGPAVAGNFGNHHHGKHHHHAGKMQVTIVVSCFRGPWNEVIWDRPNAKFIDSLVAAGYEFPEAHAIAERICRDRSLVNNGEGLKAEMHRVLDVAPRHY